MRFRGCPLLGQRPFGAVATESYRAEPGPPGAVLPRGDRTSVVALECSDGPRPSYPPALRPLGRQLPGLDQSSRATQGKGGHDPEPTSGEFCDSLCPARGNDLTRKGLRDV